MKTTLFFILTIITALSGYFAGVSDTKEKQAKHCIELSEGTDSDICDCLNQFGQTDELLCNN